jgi:hypothetical protein
MNRPLIYNLHDPQYESETYKCFYCGRICEDGMLCDCGDEEVKKDADSEGY